MQSVVENSNRIIKFFLNKYLSCKIIFQCIDRYSYGEPTSFRFSNDAYIAKLLLPLRSVGEKIRSMSFYPEPAKKFTGLIFTNF